MKTKRTITAEVVAANKKNAQRSSGPKTARGKRFSAANRRSHGLLARTVVFADDEERDLYNEGLELWTRDCDLDDMMEAALVKKIVDGEWRLLQISTWESAAVRARRRSSLSIVQALAQDSARGLEAPDMPLVNLEPFRMAMAGWECSEVFLRSGQTKDVAQSQSMLAESEGSASDQVGLAVRLTNSLDTVIRYRSTITRELHRDMELLMRHRAQRTEE